MDKIKVLMVGPDRAVHGGISAVVNEMYEAGLDKKIELKYIGTMKEGSKLKKLFVAAFAYAKFLACLPQYDIVHVHFSSDSSFLRKSYFIKAANRHNKKIILHQHGGDFTTFYEKQLSEKQRQMVADVLNMGDRMLVLTDTWKKFFSGIIDGQKIEVFPNGVMTNIPLDDTNEKDFNKILFLGRICAEKGVRELLDAVKQIHTDHPEVKLYIGGIFEDDSLKDRIEASKDYVEYLGWIKGKEKDRYLNECGILALPSYFEGFGMVLIEAMVRRSAVVASNVGGIPDIIENGADGLLIRPKDTDSLRDALIRLIDDQKLAKELGEKGREKVLEKYSVEKNIEKLLAMYSEIQRSGENQ